MGKSTASLIDSVRSIQPNNLLAIHETFVHKTIHRFHQGCTGHWEHRDIPGIFVVSTCLCFYHHLFTKNK